MRRVRHTSGILTLQETHTPTPGPGELLVRTEAIGVTLPVVRKLRPADSGTAPQEAPQASPHASPQTASPAAPQGAPQAATGEPIGGEVAGTVEAIGPDVTEYAPGDRVTGLCFGDAYAELALLHTSMASPVPAHATAREAVALVRGGLVAFGALETAGPRPGETALITAAAGGAGHLALQLARLHGGAGRVVAAVSDPAAKGAFLRDLGADAVLGYADLEKADPATATGTATADAADYALDAVGGDLLTPLVRTLADGGRLVAYSSGGGTVDAYQLLLGGKSVAGFQIRRVASDQPQRYAAWREELWRLHAEGALRPAVAAALSLDRAEEAHRLIRRRANLGKVLLTP
ncbi:zinc-binding dehydrogenase [Streptomyces sp. 891-h]|uniref:quinone oxidoreductase family protein n=1 Tax=Streptomyces sp. 891-h TaxID=2720714 RepID=UPI001FA9D19C|nr:zinc-binding dehydrogenase [Streptomyces sp. 891-h]UNZ18436.1 zinc-binding dehydrogenase [Streptomyces sp. 891-h]